jgi:hypothetical protein|tara:strand:+ start:3468 stop:3662 length:195 start_codon:yes stop_codon:yes gene_type:complete
MRYYWEALFSVEYFPYWEFTMIMMLCLQLIMLWRLHRIEYKIDEEEETVRDILKELIEQIEPRL